MIIPTAPANKYAQIHVLFRVLAKAKGAKDLNQSAAKVKAFWKNFYGVGSLTDLTDGQLVDLERLVLERIKSLKEEK